MALRNQKIILFTGGDINNIDKGIIPASIGAIIKANGYHVNVIKMDPCFNRSSINLNPLIYGEKYTLIDGEMVSINFGYYERILNQIFTKDNYITRGKIDDKVNSQHEELYTGQKIRSSDFVAATVKWIKDIFEQEIPGEKKVSTDICIIELGSSDDNEISDKTFMEALSEFKRKNDFLHIHISRLIGGDIGLVEKSVQILRNHEWLPHILICRSDTPISNAHKMHIAQLAVPMGDIDKVINIPAVSYVQEIPIILQQQNIYNLIATELSLENGPNFEGILDEWRQTIARIESFSSNVVKIALVGKYLLHPLFSDAIFQEPYESMVQQFNIAAIKCCCKVEMIFVVAQDLEDDAIKEKHDAAWALLDGAHGILIPGGLGAEGFQGMMKACKFAREKKKPFLSVCYGLQCAVIEFAQNVCNIHAGEPYENALKKVNIEMLENGNPRRGLRTTKILSKNSKLFKLYGENDSIKERNWNRMEINPVNVPLFVAKGLRFVGVGFDESGESSETLENLKNLAVIHDENDEDGYIKTIEKLCQNSRETGTSLRMQIMELKNHRFFVGIQYHAKFGLQPSLPSPPFVGLIRAALEEKEHSTNL